MSNKVTTKKVLGQLYQIMDNPKYITRRMEGHSSNTWQTPIILCGEGTVVHMQILFSCLFLWQNLRNKQIMHIILQYTLSFRPNTPQLVAH